MSFKYKSVMIMFVMLLLVIIGGVSASDANQTTDALSQDDSDETISSENQDLLSSDDSFTDLQGEIDTKDNVILDKNYTFNDTKDQTIKINKNITIDGNGHAIDANGKSNIFYVNATSVTLKNLIFINGNSTSGGAIFFNNTQTAILENCKFINTESANGAIHFTGGDLTINNCEFINSTAFGVEYEVETDAETGDSRVDIRSFGQGILYVNSTGKVTVSKSKFKNSKISAYAIKIDDAATVDFNDNVFDDNHGIIWDAEIIGAQEATLKIKSTGSVGDLVSINAGNAALTNNDFTNNEVSSLISIQKANVSMENVEIADSTIHNAIMMNNTDNVNINGLTINNVQCGEIDCIIKIQSNEVAVNDLSVENSLLGGESDNSIKIVSNTSITANNWNFNNISKPKGVNYTYFNDEHQKYVYEYTEKHNNALSIHLQANNNTSVNNLNVNNSAVGSEYGFLNIISGNLTIDNVNFENNPIPVRTNIRYDSELDMELYETETSGYSWSIEFEIADNLVMSNFRFNNASASAYTELFNINANNATILNITMVDSPLCCGEEGGMWINAQDTLIIDNFRADNITLGTGENYTSYDREHGKYVWQYSIDGEEGGFALYAHSGNNVKLTNISFTNIVGGGEEGIIYVKSKNITADNILIENITSPDYRNIYYYPDLDMYLYESYSGESSAGLVFYGQDGITNITNVKVNNDNSSGYESFFVVFGGEVNVENVSITNSKIAGEEGSGITIEANNNVNVNNIVLDNLSQGVGYNYTHYDVELGKYIWDGEFESEGGPVGMQIYGGGNATVTNINITNIKDAGYELFSVDADNVTVDNVAIENVTPYFTKEYEYNRYLDEYLVESYAGEEGCQIGISADQNAKVTNIQITNLTTFEEFLQIDGKNVTVENFTVKDSFISINQEGCYISADNLNISNFIADNIKQAPGRNETRYDTTYGKYVYDYETTGEGFGLYLDAKNVEADRLHFTNLQCGEWEGILTIRTVNLTVDDVLIENITSCYNVKIGYDSDYGRQIMTTNSSGDEGGILYIYGRGGLAQLTNVKVNNVESACEGIEGLMIVNDNVVLENFTVSNMINKGFYSSQWDKYTNQYITQIGINSEEVINILARQDVNITNMLVDNVPTSDDGINIEGENVSIIDSTFRNIKSESMESSTDSRLRQLITHYQSNEGMGVNVEAVNVKIMGTTFENITIGGDNYRSGLALMVEAENNALIENCTFKDITGESLNSTRYDSYSRKYISEVLPNYGAAVIIDSDGSSIVDSSFINCKSDYGGAIYAITPLNITGSEFINCSANLGGAIYVDGVGLFVNNTLFKQNNAINGGAVFFTNQSANNTFYNATFLENLATANGGALYIYETTQDGVNIINASGFFKNHANYNGGAFFFNDTINRIVWDDYRWHNATASSKIHDDLTFISSPLARTMIIFSEFEENSDYALNITAHNNAVGGNHTVTIFIDEMAEGYVYVNITDMNGNFIKDKDGNEINGGYLLVNGSVLFELEDLAIGDYNVSAYYSTWEYEVNPLYYHINSTIFSIYPHDLNVTANKTIYADENLTVIAELNNLTTGTVNITVSNENGTLTFNEIPVVNGTVIYNVTGLNAGDYNITVTYNGDDIFYVKSNATNVTVLKRQSKLDVSVKDNAYGNVTKIIVDVPESQTGNVTVTINNQTYTKEVTNGTVEFEVPGLTAGEWEANVTFNENRVYSENNTIFKFNVAKANLTVNATGNNVTVKDNASFNIDVPEDFKGNVTIIIDGQKYYNGPVSDLVNITALPAGDYTANITFYGDNNYNDKHIDVNFTVSPVESEINATITNATYPGNVTATIALSNNANGTIKIIVDGKNFTAEVTNGSVSFDLEGLSGGVKIADVQFITKDNYNKNVNTTATFTVFKANSTIRILANDRDVIVVLPEKVTGNVTVYVSGKEYSREIINGNVTLENVLEIGENPIVAIYDGDANFTNSRNATTLAIDKYESFINATATGSVYGGIANVTVETLLNQTGRVIITVNNVTYEKELVNGEAIFEITGLDVDEYPVDVLYLGNDKYNESSNVTSFNITKANLPAVVIAENITIMDNATFIIEHFNDFKGKLNITVDNVAYTHDINSLVTIDKLAEGNKTARVVFWGDNNYNDLQLNASFTVSRIGGTILNVTVQDVTYNTNATAVIMVSGNANGTVVLTVDGKDYDVEVKNGTGNCDLGILAAGVKEVTAKFTVTDSVNSNATATTRFNVNKADSKVDITISGNDVTVITSSTGNVTVYINGVKVIRSDEGPIVLAGALKTGNNTIFAIYDGNENYTDSQNDTVVFIAKKSSIVNVTADPITYGDDAVITVNVGENQTGYVSITVANKTYTAKINGTQVKFTIPGLNATTYKVSAAYSGDADFENQTNATDLIVNKANLTAIVEGLNVTVNDNTTFVIENMPSDFKGKINIIIDENTYVGDVISLIHMLKLPAGTYTANVTFYGDENYNDLELNTTFTVSRVEGTVMTVNVDNVDYPHNATAIITINANANGTVVVSVNGVEYAPVEVKNGLASVELGILSAGIKEVTANFTSTDSINTNATASTRFVVNKAESSVNITTEQTDVIVNVTGGMSGNVTVYINGAKEIIPFDGNQIRLADKLQTGNNTIIVEFSGNENYTSSQNDVEMFIAKKASSVNVTADPITYGSEAEIIVSVGENQTGYVTIEVYGKEYSAEIKDDKVVFTILGLNATTYHVTVKYSGDADFENQTNATDLIVNKVNLTAIVEGLNVTVNDNTTFVIENLPSDFKGKIKITVGENTYVGDAISLIHMLKLPAGTYTANVTFYDDENYNDLALNTTFTVSRIGGTVLNVTVQDVTYNTNATAVIMVSGNANGTVVLTVDGKDYEVEVKNGIANRDLGILAAGVKEVSAKFTVTDSINSNATATTRFTVNKANSSVEIIFNNTDVTITVTPGEAGKLIVVVNGIESVYEYAAPVIIEDALKVGENTVVAFYEGSENYTLSEANKTATISKKASLVNASVQSITYCSQATIIVNVPVAQTGYVTITVDNANHTAPINDGQARFNLAGLKVGEYEVNVSYSGDENYSSQINATTFNVIKADLTASVIGVNVTVGDDTKFIVSVPADFNGKVNITVDGITYSGNAQSLITMDKLAEGDKIAAVKFFDDANYNDLQINASFKVSPTSGPSGIVSIKSDNMTRGYNSPYDYQAAFLDANGNALKNTEVIFKVNGKEYKVKTNEDGIAQLTGAKLAVGKYNITSVNPVTGEEVTQALEIVKRILENKDLKMDYIDGSKFKVKVIGDDGKIAPAGEVIDIMANGVHYVAKVDKNGYASLKITLLPKKYTITAEYKGYKTTNKLVVKQTLKPVKKTIKVKKGKKITIKASLKWSNGKGIKGKKITFKIKGKTFKAKTNKKGIAKVVVKNKKILKKLKKGKKYTVKITYAVKQKFGNGSQTIKDTVKCKVKIK